MQKIIFTEEAISDLQRCYVFIANYDIESANQSMDVIQKAIQGLSTLPYLGRPLENHLDFRELIIPFSGSGYSAVFRFNQEDAEIIVSMIFHHRELKEFLNE